MLCLSFSTLFLVFNFVINRIFVLCYMFQYTHPKVISSHGTYRVGKSVSKFSTASSLPNRGLQKHQPHLVLSPLHKRESLESSRRLFSRKCFLFAMSGSFVWKTRGNFPLKLKSAVAYFFLKMWVWTTRPTNVALNSILEVFLYFLPHRSNMAKFFQIWS